MQNDSLYRPYMMASSLPFGFFLQAGGQAHAFFPQRSVEACVPLPSSS